jgi:transcription termination factor NusB
MMRHVARHESVQAVYQQMNSNEEVHARTSQTRREFESQEHSGDTPVIEHVLRNRRCELGPWPPHRRNQE